MRTSNLLYFATADACWACRLNMAVYGIPLTLNKVSKIRITPSEREETATGISMFKDFKSGFLGRLRYNNPGLLYELMEDKGAERLEVTLEYAAAGDATEKLTHTLDLQDTKQSHQLISKILEFDRDIADGRAVASANS